jgi:molybdopterin-containing oxidoreductase family iron-sulfur binding subunit
MPISRRELLQSLGAATAFVLTGEVAWSTLRQVDGNPSVAAPAAAAAAQKESHQWAAVIDLRRCDGCKYCTQACQSTHYLPKEMEWIKIYEVEDANGNHFFMPRLCMQCENPPCLKVCPVAATFKSEEGVILVNQDRCIGCRLCMAACPYEARYFNFHEPPKPPKNFNNPMPEFPVPQRIGTVGKCVLCVHYVDQGKLPACIAACPMDAIYIADLNTRVMTNRSGETYEMSRYLAENDGFRLKEELNTSPRVWYIAGHGQTIEGEHWS